MKKVIDGLLYDTDKATAAAVGHSYNADLFFINVEEIWKKLYRTKNGRFFFHISLWRTGWFDMEEKEDILPCSENEAMEFCRTHSPRNFAILWSGKIEEA